MTTTHSLPIWDCHTHLFGPWETFPLCEQPAYQPELATFQDLRAEHALNGITHGVIVQAVPYGDDHSAMMDAMRTSAGHYRGIAVLRADTPEALLPQWHAQGIRGIRLGMMKHLAGKPDVGKMLELLQRIKPLGWHALVHGELDDVLKTTPILAEQGVPLIIDHMARAPVHHNFDITALCELAQISNIWIKLSGADRVSGGKGGYRAALPLMRSLLHSFPERAIWGSDWPHVNISYPRPDVGHLMALLHEACDGDEQAWARVLSHNPSTLYA